MINTIEKTAKKFAKAFTGELTFSNLKKHTEKLLHYTVLFSDSEVGKRELQRLGIEIPETENSIVVSSHGSKVIFVKSSLPEDDKIQSLLHEAGHVVLGHMEVSNYELDSRKSERDAERFSYAVLSELKKDRTLLLLKIACVVLASLLVLQGISGCLKDRKQNTAAKKEIGLKQTVGTKLDLDALLNDTETVSAFSQSDSSVSDNLENAYFVTPYGEKYHKPNCRYVRDKNNLTQLTLEEAQKKYTACSTCMP